MLNRPCPDSSGSAAAFLVLAVTRDPTVECDNVSLYAYFTKWCAMNGMAPCAHRALSRSLMAAGYNQSPNRENGRKWLSLRVKDDAALP